MSRMPGLNPALRLDVTKVTGATLNPALGTSPHMSSYMGSLYTSQPMRPEMSR